MEAIDRAFFIGERGVFVDWKEVGQTVSVLGRRWGRRMAMSITSPFVYSVALLPLEWTQR